MRIFSKSLLLGVSIFLGLAGARSGFAADTTVLVGSGGLVFSPATANISVNDQIIWSWAGSFHSTTSGTVINGSPTPDGLWDSGVANLPHSFTNKFTAPGNFAYYCSIHYGSGMKGTINVAAAANQPPAVSIVAPANCSTLAAPATVTIQATAADGDGSITNVQFLLDATVLTNETAAPFIFTKDLAAGNFVVSIIAADNLGTTATNSVSVNVVTPAALIVSAPQISAAQFQFAYAANPGLNYVIQFSTNLAGGNWTTLATNLATESSEIFTDVSATNNPAFYRVGRLPNP